MTADRTVQISAALAAYAQLMHTSRRAAVPARQTLDLTMAELKALYLVANRDTIAIGDLVGMSARNRPAASKLVNELAQRGLVMRIADPISRRRTLIGLTEEGAALLDQLFVGDLASVWTLLVRLERADLIALVYGLHALVQELG